MKTIDSDKIAKISMGISILTLFVSLLFLVFCMITMGRAFVSYDNVTCDVCGEKMPPVYRYTCSECGADETHLWFMTQDKEPVRMDQESFAGNLILMIR